MIFTNKFKDIKKFYSIIIVFIVFFNAILISKLHANSFKINEIEVKEDFNLNYTTPQSGIQSMVAIQNTSTNYGIFPLGTSERVNAALRNMYGILSDKQKHIGIKHIPELGENPNDLVNKEVEEAKYRSPRDYDDLGVGSIKYSRKKGEKKAKRKEEVEVDEKKDIKPQIEKLFDKGIDAIFAVNEIYAANAMRIAKEQNLKVPKDISIIGFTDGLISEYSSPSITTVAQHGFTMGKQAVELLIDRIENESEVYKPKKIVISSDLKLRESTKPSS